MTSRVAAGPLPPSRENFFQRGVSALLGRRAFWVLFMLLAFSWPFARVVGMVLPDKLPVLRTVSAFELIDQNGRAFGAKDLEGRVWMVSAIHTSSPWADDLTKILVKIQHRARNLGPAFHIVTVAVDPESDTPERMQDFTGRYRVSPRIWSFLSGDAAAVRNAQAALGFEPNRAGGDPKPGSANTRGALGAPAATSELASGPLSVAVVDGKMRVRARYDLSDPKAVDALLYEVGLLVNRGD